MRRNVIGRIRVRWPAVEILVRGDSHYSQAEANHKRSGLGSMIANCRCRRT